MKGIDPKYIMWLGLAVFVEQAIGHGTVSLTNVVPAAWAPYVTSWCNLLAFLGNAVMTYQAAVSGPQVGPLVAEKSNVVPLVKPETVVKIIIAAFVLSLFLAGNPASARPLQITGNVSADAKANLGLAPATPAAPVGLAKFMSDLANIQKTVVDNVVTDINAADADASVLVNPSDPTSFRDPISHACYPAAIKFITGLPVATAPTGTLVGVQLFQKKRDFIMQIQAGLPTYLKLGCAPLLGDEAAVFTKIMGLVGVNVALNTLIPGAGALTALSF